MGYTNYFNVKSGDFQFSQSFIENVKSIIKMSGVKIGNWDGNGGEPEITNTSIALNGVGDDSYESFVLDTTTDGFGFCKTERNPYDVVVKAILMLATAEGYVDNWNFDGNKSESEYISALNLYNKATRQKNETTVQNKYESMGKAFHHLRKVLTENGWEEIQCEFDLIFTKERDYICHTIMVSHVVSDSDMEKYTEQELANDCGVSLEEWKDKQLLIQHCPDADFSLLIKDINKQETDFINVILAKEESQHNAPVFN